MSIAPCGRPWEAHTTHSEAGFCTPQLCGPTQRRRCDGCGHHIDHHDKMHRTAETPCMWRGCGCPCFLLPPAIEAESLHIDLRERAAS